MFGGGGEHVLGVDGASIAAQGDKRLSASPKIARRRAGGQDATACQPTAACIGVLQTTCGRWGKGMRLLRWPDAGGRMKGVPSYHNSALEERNRAGWTLPAATVFDSCSPPAHAH